MFAMLRAACLIACAGLCSFASAQESQPPTPSAQAEAPAPERPPHKAAGKGFPKRKSSARNPEPLPFVNEPEPPAAVAPAPGPEQERARLVPPESGEPRGPAPEREPTVEATFWSEYWQWILAVLAVAIAALAWRRLR
jgi:hypothetical protein